MTASVRTPVSREASSVITPSTASTDNPEKTMPMPMELAKATDPAKPMNILGQQDAVVVLQTTVQRTHHRHSAHGEHQRAADKAVGDGTHFPEFLLQPVARPGNAVLNVQQLADDGADDQRQYGDELVAAADGALETPMPMDTSAERQAPSAAFSPA